MRKKSARKYNLSSREAFVEQPVQNVVRCCQARVVRRKRSGGKPGERGRIVGKRKAENT